MQKQYVLGPEHSGKRADVALSGLSKEPRARLQKYFKGGQVTIDGEKLKPSSLVQAGQRITVTTPVLARVALQTPNLPIVYEDEEILVVDKPAGLLAHPVPDQPAQATVAEFARLHTSDDDPERPGIVHRLDRDTSGLMIIAKNPAAKLFMQKQFAGGLVRKTYLALVSGNPKQAEAMIDLPIGRSKTVPIKRAVVTDGKPAQTHYQVRAEYKGYSMLELIPRSGRTHQIRVHLSYIGHPVCGDALYAKNNPLGLKRHFLHAAGLSFKTPVGKPVKLESQLPPELQQVIDSLAGGV